MKQFYQQFPAALEAPEGEGAPSGAQPQPAATPPANPPANPAQEPAKTFTQEEMDRVAAKVRQEERKKAQEELEERLKREKMDETERLKAEKADVEKKFAEMQTSLERQTRLNQLIGKVSDPELALLALKPEHLKEDGSINLDRLLADKPILKPSNPNPTPGTPGGNPPGTPVASRQQQMAQALARGDMSEYIRLSQQKD